MIGDYKGTVKNKVVTALLQAYHDCLDYDGLKSILIEAGLLDLKDIKEIDPDKSLDYFSFKKIITAQNILLYECKRLLFEIGRKMSFYLFPFGKNFEEIVNELNESIDTDWRVKIIESSEQLYRIEVKNCIFCTQTGVPCDLFIGFMVHSLQKSLTTDKEVSHEIQILSEDSLRDFILTLIIKKCS